jgi:hypothetical protein
LQDRDNGRFVNVEPLFQFLFQSSKLPGQFLFVTQERSHPQERADDKHAHLDGPRTVEHIGRYDGAMLGENERQIFAMLAAPGL